MNMYVVFYRLHSFESPGEEDFHLPTERDMDLTLSSDAEVFS